MNKTYIIAEAGVNHGGSLENAKKLVDAAAAARADAVKFQTFRANALASPDAPKAEYQKIGGLRKESQLEMLRKLELSFKDQRKLRAYCARRKIDFLSSPFDLESVEFLVRDLKLRRIKIGSGEITNAPLLLLIAREGAEVILSTGMSTLADVRFALGVLAFGYAEASGKARRKPSRSAFDRAHRSPKGRKALRKSVTLLHCTSAYPTPHAQLHLRAMETLREEFELPVGFSDHSLGLSAPIAAVALGACVIEKHFTLDKTLPGPDHKASLSPEELRAMVQYIREAESALGTAEKKVMPAEENTRSVARKSLAARKAIAAGEKFSEANLTVLRPGCGVSAREYFDWIGKPARKDFKPGDWIE